MSAVVKLIVWACTTAAADDCQVYAEQVWVGPKAYTECTRYEKEEFRVSDYVEPVVMTNCEKTVNYL